MTGAMKENRAHTSIGRKANIVKDQVSKADLVDLSKVVSENKRRVRVTLDKEVKRKRREAVAEPVPKSDKGLGLRKV